MNSHLLELCNVHKSYSLSRGFLKRDARVRAVGGVSLAVHAGETLGLVGESGCGKSTLSRLLNLLEPPSAGTIRIAGEDVQKLTRAARHQMRRRIQMVFQDPYSSLNPRRTVGATIREPLDNFAVETPSWRRDKVAHLLESVGLQPSAANDYPHEFSGGQRQRIAIARALALSPDIIIADEPVSALDVSVQAQILNLLQTLRESSGLTMVFVSHDLSVVRHVSDRIAVMYLGELMEIGSNSALFSNPLHPYTRALIASAPPRHPRDRQKKTILRGDIPSPTEPLPGCPFYSRCTIAEPGCAERKPQMVEVTPGHSIACHVVAGVGAGREAVNG